MRDMLVGHTTSMTLAEQCLFNAQAPSAGAPLPKAAFGRSNPTARRVEAGLARAASGNLYSKARAWG